MQISLDRRRNRNLKYITLRHCVDRANWLSTLFPYQSQYSHYMTVIVYVTVEYKMGPFIL